MAKVKSKESNAKTASKKSTLKLKTKKDFHKQKLDKKITRAKIKKSAPGKVNLFSLDKVTTQTRSRVPCEDERDTKEFITSKSETTTSTKSIQSRKEGCSAIDLKQSQKKKQTEGESNVKKSASEKEHKKVVAGKSLSLQNTGIKGRNLRHGRGFAKSTTDVYKSRHNIGKRAASGRVFSYKETEISLVFPDNFWSSSSSKVDLALPKSSSSSSRSSSKSSRGTSEECDFEDSEIQFNFEAQKKRYTSQDEKDSKENEQKKKKSDQGTSSQTSSKQAKKSKGKSQSMNTKFCDSESSTSEEDEPVKKSKKAKMRAKYKKPKKRKPKAAQIQPRSPRIQRTACLNANAINSLMYDYSVAPKKLKTSVSPECSQESSSDGESSESSSTEDQSQSEPERRPSPCKGANSSKHKKKEIPEKKTIKSKKKPKVPDKKKTPKKRRKRDVFDDVIIAVPAKRMASLNAQAIMAACKDWEEAKPVKLSKELKPSKDHKEKQEKSDKPLICDVTEKVEVISPNKGELKEQFSPFKRKKSPLRGMKLLQKQVLEGKSKIEQLDVNAKYNNQELGQHLTKASVKDPYEFIDVVDVDDQKSPLAAGQAQAEVGVRPAPPVSSPEIQVVDPPAVCHANTMPNAQQSHFQPMRPMVPTAKPVPHYPRLNMPYRMNDPHIRHPQMAHFSHTAGAFQHSYPHGGNSNKVSMPPQTSLPQSVPTLAQASHQSSQPSPFQRPPSHAYDQATQQQQQSTFHSQNQTMYGGGGTTHPPIQQSVPPYPPTSYPTQQVPPSNKTRYPEVPTTANMTSVASLGVSPPPPTSQLMMQEDSSPSSSDRSSVSTEKSTGPSHVQAHKTTQMGNTATYPYPHGNNTGQNVNSQQYMQGMQATGMAESFGAGYHHHQMVGNPRHYGPHAAFGPTAYRPVVQHQRQDNNGTANQQTVAAPHNLYMRYGYYQPAGPLIQHPGGTAFHLMQQQPHLKNFMPPAIVHSQPFRSHTPTEANTKNLVINKPGDETKSPSKSAKSSQDKSKGNFKALDLSIESRSGAQAANPPQTSKASVITQPSPMKPTKDILDLDSKKVRVHKGAVGETDRGSPLKTTKGNSAKKLKTDSSGYPVQTYKFEPKQHQMAPIRPNVSFVEQGFRANAEASTDTAVVQPTVAETKTVASNLTIPFYSMPLSGHMTRMTNPSLQPAYSGPKPEKSPKKGTQVKNSSSKERKPEHVAANMDLTGVVRPAVHMQLPQMMKPVMSVIPIPSVPPAQSEIYSQTGTRPGGKGMETKPPVVMSPSGNIQVVSRIKELSKGSPVGGTPGLSAVNFEVKKKGIQTPLPVYSEEKKNLKKDVKKVDGKSPKQDINKSKEAKILKSEIQQLSGKASVSAFPKVKPDSPRQKPKPETLKVAYDSPKEKYKSPKGSHNISGKVKIEKCKQTLQFTDASSFKDDPRIKHEFLKRKMEMKQKGDITRKTDAQKAIRHKTDSPRSKQDAAKAGKLDSPKQKSDPSKVKLESPKAKQQDSPKGSKCDSPRQRPDTLKIKPDSPRQQKSDQSKARADTPKSSKGETTPKQKKEDGVKNNGSGKKERRRSAEEKKLSPGNGGRRRIQSAPPVIHCAWRWEGQPELKPVSFQGESPVLRKCYPAVKHTDGDIVKVRDCVLVKSGPRKRDIPFVAKIAALWEHQYGEMMMSVLWYYRPEQTEMERLPRRERCEIFASRHRDVVPVACIDDKAYVLTFNEYCRYKSQQRRIAEHGSTPSVIIPQLAEGSLPLPPMEAASETVFLCRRVYDVKLKRILKNPQASYIQQSPNSSKPHTPNSSSKSSSPHSESPIDARFQQQQAQTAKVDLMHFMNQLAQLRYPETSELQPSKTVDSSKMSISPTMVKTEQGMVTQNLPVFPSTEANDVSISGGFSGISSKSSLPGLKVVKTDLMATEEQKPEILNPSSSINSEKQEKEADVTMSSVCDKSNSPRPFASYINKSKEMLSSKNSAVGDINLVQQEKCDVVIKMEEACDVAEADTQSVSSTETECHKPEASGCFSGIATVRPAECSSSTGQQQQTASVKDSGKNEEKTLERVDIVSPKSERGLENSTEVGVQPGNIQDDKITSQNLNCSSAETGRVLGEVVSGEVMESSSSAKTSKNESESEEAKPGSAESLTEICSHLTKKDDSAVSASFDAEIVNKEDEETMDADQPRTDEMEVDGFDRCDSPDPERLVIDISKTIDNEEMPVETVSVRSKAYASSICSSIVKEAEEIDSQTETADAKKVPESASISEEALAVESRMSACPTDIVDSCTDSEMTAACDENIKSMVCQEHSAVGSKKEESAESKCSSSDKDVSKKLKDECHMTPSSDRSTVESVSDADTPSGSTVCEKEEEKSCVSSQPAESSVDLSGAASEDQALTKTVTNCEQSVKLDGLATEYNTMNKSDHELVVSSHETLTSTEETVEQKPTEQTTNNDATMSNKFVLSAHLSTPETSSNTKNDVENITEKSVSSCSPTMVSDEKSMGVTRISSDCSENNAAYQVDCPTQSSALHTISKAISVAVSVGDPDYCESKGLHQVPDDEVDSLKQQSSSSTVSEAIGVSTSQADSDCSKVKTLHPVSASEVDTSKQQASSPIVSEAIGVTVSMSDSDCGKNKAVHRVVASEVDGPKQQVSLPMVSSSGLKSPTGVSRIEQIVSQIKMAGGAAGGGNKSTECSTSTSATSDLVETQPIESSTAEKQ